MKGEANLLSSHLIRRGRKRGVYSCGGESIISEEIT